MRLVNPLSVQDLGLISNIVDTGPKSYKISPLRITICHFLKLDVRSK